MTTTKLTTNGHRILDGWLVQLCLTAVLLLFGASLNVSADNDRDIITFTGGQEDPNNSDIYVIDAGPDDVIPDPDGGMDFNLRIRLSRPLGASATHEASITLVHLFGWEEENTVTFAPGETEKTVEIFVHGYASEFYNGNAPAVFSVLRTGYAEAAYDVLIYNINHTATEEPQECSLTTSAEALNVYDLMYRDLYFFRWGKYILFTFNLGSDVKISADSRLVIQTRSVDHTNLPIDADDYGMSKTRNVVLTPINVGAVSDMALYLYRPSDDEYLYSFQINDENYGLYVDNSEPIENDEYRAVLFGINEVGPFEVANPAEGALTSLFFSQEDMQNTFFLMNYPLYAFQPKFSNVTIDKTTYKSGETMTITATMDNWRVMKRAHLRNFMNCFGVTLNGNQTTEPRRFDLDEATGTVTYYVTAPTVAANTTVNVDFGPTKLVEEYNEGVLHKRYMVLPGSEGFFTVTVTSETATAIPATAIDFVDMPADGSNIHLEGASSSGIDSQRFSLAITSTPAGATDASTVTYTVTNNGTNASIGTNDDGSLYFNTGNNTGDLTLTATLASGVSTSRTYHLTTNPGKRIHTANTYLAGTTLPKFQFEISAWNQLEGSWEWTAVGDDVTVNYTHANGSTWTEHYHLSNLNSSIKAVEGFWMNGLWSGASKLYDLPFVFTEEHPDATVDQIGQPIVTAEVIVNMQNPSGHRIQVVSTASLEPRLKDFSFKGYTRMEEHYHYLSDPTLSSEVMYLPTRGFTVGYEIPELGLRETYNNQSGDPVPDWLELQNDVDGLYTTATIKIHPDLDRSQSYDLTLYTLAQRSYDPDEVMQRDLTCNVTFSPIQPEGNMVYRVNGQNVTGDLTFDNADAIAAVTNTLKADGFIERGYASNVNAIEDIFNQMKAFFTVYDNVFEGAEVTLTRQGDEEPLQTLTHYKGTFMFAPPADGRTYIIDVFYPAFNKHYKSTFVSHPLTGIRAVSLNMKSNNYVFTYTNDGNEYNIPFNHQLDGFIYVEDTDEFFLKKDEMKACIGYPDEFHAIVYNNTPELKTFEEINSISQAESGDADRYYVYRLNSAYVNPTAYWRQRTVTFNWDDLNVGNTLVTVIDSKGQPVTNATLNYACVDKDMSNPNSMGSAIYNASFGGYQIDTDPAQYAELIEVVIPGREHPQLNKMNLWNYGYSRNRGKQRSHTIMLQDDDAEVSQANLETLKLTGHYSRSAEYEGMKAENTPINLLTVEKSDTLDYSETADYPTVFKLFRDERFGTNVSGYRKSFARLSFNLHSDDILNTDGIKLVNTNGTVQLSPDATYTRFIGKDVFTTFNTNHYLLDFDLCDKIAYGVTEKLSLVRNGNETLLDLPLLRNNSVDMLDLTKNTTFDEELATYDPTQVDDEIKDKNKGNTDMGAIGNIFGSFGSFNFSTPPVIPFTLNIERKDDYFLVRGIYEQNFIPYGQMEDLMDAAAYMEWFEEQFTECMNSVNNMRNDVEDRLNQMKKMSDAFVGIKGYISGIGHYDPKTGKLDVNFYDGGIIMEASAHVMGKTVVANIAQFGVSIDLGIFSKLGVLNRKAANGDASVPPRIDIITESRFNFGVGAWAELSLDIKIAKVAIGVMGYASIDVVSGTATPTYQKEAYAGTKVAFDFKLSAYVTGKFLFWGGTKDYTLLSGNNTFYDPDNATNPYHPDFGEPIFSYSQQNVTKNYKKLSRKTRRALDGTSLFDNVSGMAQPTYLLGGLSLLFNNLKTPSNYNDDRLQVYSGGSESDFVDTGVEAPMYDFAEDHNNQFELVAFEQMNAPINGDALESYNTDNQVKLCSEMSDIHVAWRNNGGEWQTQTIGSMEGAACVTPAVAVSKEDMFATHAAVIWQQGKTRFSDNGERYIDGSLMLSRFTGSEWTDPVEIMRINRRNVPVEYKMTIKNTNQGFSGDEVLVALALKQDVNNLSEPTKLVYLNVTAEDWSFDSYYQVHTRYTNVEANMLQMERVLDPSSEQTYNGIDYHCTDGTNLMAYMEYTDNGRNLKLTTVNMKGEPTGKLNSNVGMMGRMVNDYRMVVDDNARDLGGVALLWSQSDQETTDNGDGTATMEIKNRIYASKLCSDDNQLYFSSPIAVADIDNKTEKMILASMDGYLDGLNMKVAYSAANYSDAAAVREVPVVFTNDIEHTATFNPYDVKSAEQVPFTITVENKGFEPINRIDVTIADNTTSYDVRIMPMGTTDIKVLYPVADNFDGTISYDIAANFIPANSNALKARGKKVANRPHRIEQSGSQLNVRQVDMALKMLSKKTGADGKTNIVVEVSNHSLLPLANDMTVKVGLYNSPVVDENAVALTEVTLNATDLYDATAKQNKDKMVTLTIDQPDFSQALYLCTVPQLRGAIVNDVLPTNNVLPVSVAGKYMLGDVNGDKKVTISDAVGIVRKVSGTTPSGFIEKAADVTRDGGITINDAVGVVNMILKK